MTVCIDTNVYVQFKKGDGRVREVLESAEEVIVPAVVLGELYAGFAMGTREKANLSELQRFLEIPGIVVAAVTDRVAQRYGSLIKSLAALGSPIPTNDVWIASTALETGARLLSFDAHFARVPAIVTIPLD